ncbi:hypothetical protein CK203_039146 [Vitis vinifera]|uniref:Carbohydrate kinase PfkB domain-containing protein n=1 Tax=Vitis vinifera TaxID=29760 RepID=A0A438IFL0_VITVI|nr:hypothetical protein CK203_039146 [Vitis vinifera]
MRGCCTLTAVSYSCTGTDLDDENASPEAALEFLAKHCQWAVVTLGSNECLAKWRRKMVQVPAIGEAKAIDATRVGHLFAGGFLYGLVKGLSLEECCRVGTCSGCVCYLGCVCYHRKTDS